MRTIYFTSFDREQEQKEPYFLKIMQIPVILSTHMNIKKMFRETNQRSNSINPYSSNLGFMVVASSEHDIHYFMNLIKKMSPQARVLFILQSCSMEDLRRFLLNAWTDFELLNVAVITARKEFLEKLIFYNPFLHNFYDGFEIKSRGLKGFPLKVRFIL